MKEYTIEVNTGEITDITSHDNWYSQLFSFYIDQDNLYFITMSLEYETLSCLMTEDFINHCIQENLAPKDRVIELLRFLFKKEITLIEINSTSNNSHYDLSIQNRRNFGSYGELIRRINDLNGSTTSFLHIVEEDKDDIYFLPRYYEWNDGQKDYYGGIFLSRIDNPYKKEGE